MKLKLAISAAAAIAALTSVHAQTVVDLTGSTAGRSSVHGSIRNVLVNETFAYTGSNIGNANSAIFVGEYPAGTPVIVRTTWSGSATGLSDLSTGNSVSFIPTNATTSAGGTSNTAAASDPSSAEVAFSDVYVGSTTVPSTGLVNNNTFVIPFKWIASADANANSRFTNITPNQARSMLNTGSLPLSIITGNATDNAVTVLATGRDNGSGTRITALADIGYGVNTNVVQTEVLTSGINITGYQDFAQGTNYGYTSGGTLANVLNKNATGDAVDTLLVTYLGLSDAVTALTNNAASNQTPAKELTYNGVAYSASAVYNGSYSFWGYLHLYYKNTLTGVAKSFADALRDNLKTNPGSSGLAEASMQVKRTVDGGNIQPK